MESLEEITTPPPHPPKNKVAGLNVSTENTEENKLTTEQKVIYRHPIDYLSCPTVR